MKGFAFIILFYIFLGIESPLMKIGGIEFLLPEISLIFVVYIAVNFEFIEGIITIFVIGLLKDGFFAEKVIGVNSEIFVIISLFLNMIKEKYSINQTGTLTLFTLGLIVVNNILLLIFSLLFNPDVSNYFDAIKLIPLQIIVTFPFALLFHSMLRKIDIRFFKPKGNIFFRGK